ncbi:acyl-CoA dehydrogenase family protein [Bacillus testis]|uniref:acyl-CoA dehydrogenase family protein n=1 Tax=Bacillus testis TaxID=1622072 RepID=UPI000A6A6C9E|nr:acyl-CoA dehydrogenase family protein [Bacillus testis]
MFFYRNEEEHSFLQELEHTAEKFAARARHYDETRSFHKEDIEDLIKIGYTKSTLPVAYGGKGLGVYTYLLAQETIAQYSGPTALAIGWHCGILLELQDPKRKWDKDVLAKLFTKVSNGALINRAASEPQTGSPTRGGRPATTAIMENGKWVITGKKTYTSLAPALDLFLVSAWIPSQEKVGWFLIDSEAKGVSINYTWNVMSMQGTGSEDLILDRVSVEEKYLVEYAEKGTMYDSSWLLHIPACYIGIAKAAADEAVKFAAHYSPNSIQGTISDLPNVQAKIGNMQLELLQSRHFLYSVAAQWEQQPAHRKQLRLQLGAVKTAVTNQSISIVDQAMRIVGAQSLQMTNPLQRYYRDVRAGLHNPPMDDMVIQGLALQRIQEMKKSVKTN